MHQNLLPASAAFSRKGCGGGGHTLHPECSPVKSGYCHDSKGSPGKAWPLLWSCGTQLWRPDLQCIALATPIVLPGSRCSQGGDKEEKGMALSEKCNEIILPPATKRSTPAALQPPTRTRVSFGPHFAHHETKKPLCIHSAP